jgi:hypothetical protein
VLGWETLDSNEVTYTGVPGTCSGNPYGGSSCNGLFSLGAVYGMQKGLRQAITKLGGSVNWGEFDNDGPDGIPNSGDDDGFVDMAMFVQPAKDGACGPSSNNHMWSLRLRRFTRERLSGRHHEHAGAQWRLHQDPQLLHAERARRLGRVRYHPDHAGRHRGA